MTSNQTRGLVLVASSRVVRGAVGGRGPEFALQRLGHEVCSLPTVLLPWHPGRGPGTRVAVPDDGFAALTREIAGAVWLGEATAILSGYFATSAQVEAFAALVQAVKRTNPQALYLCDPVLGDAARLYVPEQVACAIRDALLPLADIATPNLFELGWLTGMPVADMAGAARAARGLGPPRVLVTSVPGLMRGRIANLLVTKTRGLVVETQEMAGAPHGTGDLLAALFLARLVEGRGEEGALASSSASTFELLVAAARAGRPELDLAGDQDRILRPMAHVEVRQLKID